MKYSLRMVLILMLFPAAILACGFTVDTSAQPNLALTVTAQAAILQQGNSQQPANQQPANQANSNPQAANQTNVNPPAAPPASTSTQSPAPTATSSVPMVTVSQNTNCRTGPSKYYDENGILNAGQSAVVVGKDTADNYWIINNPNGQGTCWLWGQYATVTGSTSALKEYATPIPPAGYSPAVDNLFINYSCDTSKAVTGSIPLEADLSWDQATNAKGVNVYRDGHKIASLDTSTTSYIDHTTLDVCYSGPCSSPGTSVTYQVEAYSNAGKAYSNDVTIFSWEDCQN